MRPTIKGLEKYIKILEEELVKKDAQIQAIKNIVNAGKVF